MIKNIANNHIGFHFTQKQTYERKLLNERLELERINPQFLINGNEVTLSSLTFSISLDLIFSSNENATRKKRE